MRARPRVAKAGCASHTKYSLSLGRDRTGDSRVASSCGGVCRPHVICIYRSVGVALRRGCGLVFYIVCNTARGSILDDPGRCRSIPALFNYRITVFSVKDTLITVPAGTREPAHSRHRLTSRVPFIVIDTLFERRVVSSNRDSAAASAPRLLRFGLSDPRISSLRQSECMPHASSTSTYHSGLVRSPLGPVMRSRWLATA